MHEFNGHGDPAWHIAGTIIWIVFLAAVIVLGVLIVRQLLARPLRPAVPPGSGLQRSPALDELDIRYARGEIGREEYLGRRTDLLAATGLAWPGPGTIQYGAPPAAPPPPPPPAAEPAPTPPDKPAG